MNALSVGKLYVTFMIFFILKPTKSQRKELAGKLESSFGMPNVYEAPQAKLPTSTKSEINVKEGGDATINCAATGHPKPTIQWTLTGAGLSKKSVNLTKSELKLTKLRRDESGRVTCRASNGIGSPSFATIRINVLYIDKPVITVHMPKIEKVSSSSMWFENTVHIRCEVTSNPKADFSWNKDGHLMRIDTAAKSGIEIRKLMQFKPQTSVVVMRIRNANSNHYGKYLCSATLGKMGRNYQIPATKESFSFNSLIRAPNIVLRSPSTVVANVGDAVRLQCDILDGSPVPYVTWVRKELPIPTSGIFSSNRLTLDIVGIEPEDAGSYFCVASNNVDGPVRKKVEVVIRYILPMQFWIVPDPLQDDRRLALGTDIRLICYTEAQPKDEVIYSWYKQNSAGNDVLVNTDLSNNLIISYNKVPEVRRKVSFPAYSSHLEIHRVVSDDYGVYVCKASLKNTFNMTVKATIPVTREAAPAKVYAVQSVVMAREGDKTVLACRTVGRPKPKITWTRESNGTSALNSEYATNDGKYVIPNVSRNAAGTYVCATSRLNGFSKLSKTNSFAIIELIVNFTADLQAEFIELRQGSGKPLSLNCYVLDAEPSWPLQYVWKKDGLIIASVYNKDDYGIPWLSDKDYGEYSCNVRNYVGTSTCFIRVTGKAYPAEFYYKKSINKGTSSTVFPEVTGDRRLFVYLLSWTQKLPFAVDPILKYRIRWRSLLESLIQKQTSKTTTTVTPWKEDVVIAGEVTYGGLITYELHNLSIGRYEVEVIPITRFGEGDSARREITVKKIYGPRPTLQGPSFFCGFDDEYICGFLQEKSLSKSARLSVQNDGSTSAMVKTDTFDWIWNNEQTQVKRTPRTGPTYDHTYNLKTGGYLFIEASKADKGDFSKIVSPMFWDVNSSEQCLKFFYNMYGIHIGRLRVLKRMSSGAEQSIWSKSGDQKSSLWKSASVTISSKVPYQIIFEATITKSLGYLGDIAIDDVLLSDGGCPQTTPTSSSGMLASSTTSSSSSLQLNFHRWRSFSSYIPLILTLNFMFLLFHSFT